ncbi:PhzF family phenazine biosynthesis isomerase [Pseudooceanicola sp. GBMRC 2024]|uniref:PhzF family phenazine biosynthesis isomerase n=1 Tax=Pseudooceanicola albus TaxID=2692189 RepID=A0A6L7G516_9RHOB|nr:PhzF family phenazine biosynthesis protein [Pseudooceanicola albus]MXN17723.1 PhzF family phenazine biosynthesis isomerase [Pseudooceanicola albus]
MTKTPMYLPSVFPAGPGGGNPAPIWLNADTLTSAQMQAMTKEQGYESGFVLTPQDPANHLRLRFFVPEHEMSMCGHATIGALWVLRALGRLPAADTLRIETASGLVTARVPADGGAIAISQPWGIRAALAPEHLADLARVLNVEPEQVEEAANGCTSRVKTVIRLAHAEVLQRLEPDWNAVAALCETLDSTGLYPFAWGTDPWLVHARQFPRNSGYPEDAATGIAAAALACALSLAGQLPQPRGVLRVRQGEAMGRPSEIEVEVDASARSCWIRGICTLEPEIAA